LKLRLLTAGLAMAVMGALPASAQFLTFATPTVPYTGGTTLVPIPGANFSTTTSLTDGVETFGFSSTVDVRTVPAGGWSTWNSPPAVESATPKVIGAPGATTLTITLSPSRATFGIEIEPNSGTQPVTVTYFNGVTTLGTIAQSVVATSGALLFAASSSTPITSVTISVPAGGGFAMAQFRYGSNFLGIGPTVPTAGMPAMSGLAIALLACGSLLARRQNLDRA
jgi:hypothetical protein